MAKKETKKTKDDKKKDVTPVPEEEVIEEETKDAGDDEVEKKEKDSEKEDSTDVEEPEAEEEDNGDNDDDEGDAEKEDNDEDDDDDEKESSLGDDDQNDGVVVINSDTPDEAHWYVVHTYSGHENKVATTLKQRVEVGGHTDRIFKLFIPQQQKIVVSEGKKRSVEERLFPGYVIVQMLLDDDSWYVVRSTPGVTGFVGMGSTPTPLPESEVKSLMRFAKMEAPKFEAKFRVGDSVKIKEGPFKDFLGKVDEVNDDQGKVKVLVSVFGRETPVELDFEQVVSL